MIKSFSGKFVLPGDSPEKSLIEALTEREIDVIRLISREYSSPEIADKLNLAVSTVDTYRKSLLKKLKVKNAVGLAMYAVKNKII